VAFAWVNDELSLCSIEAADLRNRCRRAGVQIGTIDALLAELCIRHGLTMLTTFHWSPLVFSASVVESWMTKQKVSWVVSKMVIELIAERV